MLTARLGLVLRAAALLALALVQAAWLTQSIPWTLKILPLGLLVAALASPPISLIALAGLAPFTTEIARLAASPFPGSKLLEQLVLAVVTGALVRFGGASLRTRLGPPAAVVAFVAMASAAAVLPARLAAAAPGASFQKLVEALWHSEYFERPPVWDPLYFALLAGEGALLGWTVERLARRSPELRGRVLQMALISTSALGFLSVSIVVRGALRSGPFLGNFMRLFAMLRANVQTDVNAAGSLFVLAGLASLAVVAGSWRRVALNSILVAGVMVGLWLTGSRVALASFLAALALAAIVFTWRSTPARRKKIAIGLAAALVVTAVAISRYPLARNATFAQTFETRALLAKAGITMFRSAPVWGIGIGRFFERSGPLAGARLATLLGGGHDRENAHNNFLQVLAEQGLVGLAAFVLVLGAVAWGGIRDELATPDFRRFWLLIALFGCLLTWLTGHPMLVPEFAFVFWIYLALLSSFTAPPRIPGAPWIAMLVVLCVIASVPIRAISELRNADLEYLAVGMSQWQHDDVIAYRRGGTMFSLYVPATGTLVAIPAKRAAGTPDPLLLELRLDGHLINSIPLGGDEWQTLSFTAPSVKRRFVLIDFLVPNAPTASNRESDLVHLGKPSGR